MEEIFPGFKARTWEFLNFLNLPSFTYFATKPNNMRRVFLLPLLIITISSCNFIGERVQGNGNIKSVTRDVKDFNRVEVSHAISLHVTQDSSYSLRIETDENLIEYLEVFTNGDQLRIRVRDNYNLNPTKAVDVYVSAPLYTGLSASGACHVFGTNKISSSSALTLGASGASEINLELKAPQVDAEVSGASTINLRGETKDLTIDGSGASQVHCFDLMAENVNIDISGACDADVFASVKLDADASGASHIKYKGSASVHQSSSGASGISKAD